MKILLFVFLTQFLLFGSEYAVIANKALFTNSKQNELSASEIKMIFLKKHTMINEIKLVPINLDLTSRVRESFEKNVLEMSRSRLKSFWTKEHYLGHRPPLNMKSFKSVLSFVKKIDGAIGYVPLEDSDDSVEIIYRWSD